MQAAIRQRCKKYPADWSEQQHRATLLVPAAVASIIRESPLTVSAAVRSFYSRDDLDLRACRVMKHFSPASEKLIKARVRFSRCLYAMLAKPRYLSDISYGVPPL